MSSNFYCSLCEVDLPDESHLQVHLGTAKHLSMLNRVTSAQGHAAKGGPAQRQQQQQQQQEPNLGKGLECQLCDVKCTSLETYQMHMKGAKHAKKQKEFDFQRKAREKDPEVHCELCNLTLHPELMATHRTGMKHLNAMKAAGSSEAEALIEAKKSKVAGVKALQSVKKKGAPSLSQMMPPQDNYQQLLSRISKDELTKLLGKRFHMECSVCHVEFSTFSQAEHHFNSKAHRNAYVEHQKQQILSKGRKCEICNVVVSSEELYQSHVKGYKHTLKENGGQIPPGHEYYEKFLKQQEAVQNLKSKKP